VNFDGTVAAGFMPLARLYARVKALTLENSAGEALAILISMPILLGVAFWNGYPLIFYDTGAYILEGLGHVFVAERGPVYSLFLRYGGAAQSLWIIAWLQAAMTSFVIVETARIEAPQLEVWKLAGIAIALSIVTGIGWYVGQIEPDCMTALVVLSLYLLAFRYERLDLVRAFALAAIAAFATASHPAHLGLAGGLILCTAAVRIAAQFLPRFRFPIPKLAVPTTSFFLAVSLVLAANYELADDFFISRTGSVFEFARMLQDGLIRRLLNDSCATTHFKLCAFRTTLPNRADAFLWDADSPFNKLKRFSGPVDEYQEMVDDSLLHYPLANIGAALRDTLVQFSKIRTGDQIEPQEWILYSDLAHYVPHQMNSYMSARQQQGELHFGTLNIIHVSVAVLAMLILALLVWEGVRRRDWRLMTLPAFVLIALFGNAFVCGVFSNPHDRYQSRLIWVPVFVILLTAPTTAPLVLAKLSRIRHLIPDA
jgi:hypothetical protein